MKKNGLIIVGSFLFFGILCIVFGVGIYPDSDGYLMMAAGREPLYPLFLLFCKKIFGEGQLVAAIVIQNVLATVSVSFFTISVKKIFLEGRKWCGFQTFCIWLCGLMPHIMTPLGSASRMVLSNSILTESVAYSLYLLFGTFLLRGLLTKESKKKIIEYLCSIGMALLLSMTRNQLMTMFGVWLIVAGFSSFVQGEKELKKKFLGFLGVFFVFVTAFGIRVFAYNLYNAVFFENYNDGNAGSINIFTTMLYLSEESDAEAITNPELRELFIAIVEDIKEQKLSYTDATGNPVERALHYEECYDVIGFDVAQPQMREYLYGLRMDSEQVTSAINEISKEMLVELLPLNWTRYLYNYGCSLCCGLVRTVALPSTLFSVYAVLLYLAGVALLIHGFVKEGVFSKTSLFLLMALGMTLVNAGGTSLMIMCLSRYMIYNTTFVYGAGFLALAERMERQNGI